MAKATSKKLRTGVKAQDEGKVVIGAKMRATLLGMGAAVADAEVNKGATVLTALFAFKGKRPEEIAIGTEGVETRWKQVQKEMASKDRDRVISGMRQRISEEKAVLRFFSNAWGMTEATQTRHYKALEGLGYHATVSYCRKVNAQQSGASTADGRRKGSAEVKALKRWEAKTDELVKGVENNIRFAPLAALVKLERFVKKMIAVRERIESKGKGEQKPAQVVKMLRRAA